MLDSETKRRIDTARDILVGKVPDPKSQVEQITIALIYKFMDDMDAEAEEMGGVRSFFVGEYEKFSWAKLLSPALGGFEMLNLYSEAVDKMTRNEGVPQLFRDVFKNAYLPYRDPETLKMFLKTINEFNYDHSEKLGDAFEYLLSILGSQGDAGQFRTPRHIIDFMVKVIDPKKEDTILDPACGTAGFLISAYKHVLANNEKDGKPGGNLKPEERTKLANNIRGYDISPDMVRLSLVNLYLHGFTTPNIFEYDTLTSQDRWNEYADVILANPPFMSPKGGIKPHNRFSVQSNRSEVLFVDYMAEHLTPNGRAAIIVPEGIIFQTAGAYKQLRSYLIENNFLWAVVSLPGGMFNPYAGVKTSILLLDKSLAKKTDKILFVKIEKDGYELGSQRKPLCNEMGDKPENCPKHSDLPDTLITLCDWHTAVLNGKPEYFTPTTDSALLVPISQIAETGDYNLSADRYREVVRIGKQHWPMVKLSEVCKIERGASPRPIDKFITTDANGVNWIKIGDGSPNSMYISSTKEKITQEGAKKSHRVQKGDFILSNSMSFGHPYILNIDGCIHDGWLLLRPSGNHFIKEYLYHILGSDEILEQFTKLATGGVVNNLNSALVRSVEIPLPPLETQRQIVDKIMAHQRIIDGARQIVQEWKPDLGLELSEALPDGQNEWGKTILGNVCTRIPDTIDPQLFTGEINYIGLENIESNTGLLVGNISSQYSEIKSAKNKFQPGDILYGKLRPNLNKVYLAQMTGICSTDIYVLRAKNNIEPMFLELFLRSENFVIDVLKGLGGAQLPRVNFEYMTNLQIPLPPLDIQQKVIAHIELERAVIDGNRKLVDIFGEKVKKIIHQIWDS
ncbi:MAG: N-6 DNA methylase [Chloroflexi bacterium]|nr:N-6 DNA methylase [Chloroflexota bacterium]